MKSGRLAIGPAPSVTAQERHKPAVKQYTRFEFTVFFPRLHQLLTSRAANGNHEQASFVKLIDKRRGNFGRGRGDQNCVIWCAVSRGITTRSPGPTE